MKKKILASKHTKLGASTVGQSDIERQASYDITYTQNLKKKKEYKLTYL